MVLKTVLIDLGSAVAIVFQKRSPRIFAIAPDPPKKTHLKKLAHATLLILDPNSLLRVLSSRQEREKRESVRAITREEFRLYYKQCQHSACHADSGY